MFEDILKRHKPRGWRVRHSKRFTENALAAKALDQKGSDRTIGKDLAVADFERRTIRAPFVGCEYTLHIVLHEYGHVALGHGNFDYDNEKMPMHKQEYEADEWAMTIMRLEGVAVSKAIRHSSRRYMEHCIKRDVKKGLPIHTHIARKAKVNIKENEDAEE